MSSKLNVPEYSVSEFNKSFHNVIELNFSYIRIRGEISEIRPATKGQIYLTLKDDNSILSGVIWESKKKYLQFNPELGIEMIATGRITTWSRYKTTYQIDIDQLEIAGEGALLKLIEDRKKRLQSQGFFDEKCKKDIPYLPSRLGIITSSAGSVIHDILKKLKERFPIAVDIWPVSVQGSEAATSIITAIRGFNDHLFEDKPDVIIIARGGGSPEDLMGFNDEQLAKEVFKSNIPIISAIGHETDTTIIDYVSDKRVSTPTAAAELVVPLKKELVDNLTNVLDKLDYFFDNNFIFKTKTLTNLSRLLKSPHNILQFYKEKYQSVFEGLNKEVNLIYKKNFFILSNLLNMIKLPESYLKLKKSELYKLKINLEKQFYNNKNNQKKIYTDLIRLLNSNSIRSNLKKGYVLLSKSQKIIKQSNQIKAKDSVKIKFYDKSISVSIKKIN